MLHDPPPFSAPRAAPADPRDWLSQHGDAMFAYAMRILASSDLAEDVVQDSLLAAWRSRDQFQNQSSPRTWLLSIVKNKCIDILRRKIRREQTNADELLLSLDTFFTRRGLWKHKPASAPLDPADSLQIKELSSALDRCMGRLSHTLSRAFVLREIEQTDTDDVCQLLDISAESLWQRMHRAKLALRACLERSGWSHHQ